MGILAILFGAYLWAVAPMSWRQHWESTDGTFGLLVLFLVVPAVLALLWVVGFVCGAFLLTPFIGREDARRALLASPYGGHMGKWEGLLLSRFKSHGSSNT
jgi:hypothetical protein